MIFLKEVFLISVLMINSNSAINLNIFGFNKAAIKNVTKLENISIQPTATLTSSIQVIEPTDRIVNHGHISDLIPSVDNEKYEMDNENEESDASPEVSFVSIPHVPSPGQEIDETRNSSRYSVVESVEEGNNSKHLLGNFKLPSYFSTIPKVTLPKLPTLPKKKTVTFTTTIVSKFTKYEKVYPSCVKLENIKSICDGTLVTIQPTPTRGNHIIQSPTKSIYNDANDTYDVIEPPENRRRRDQGAVPKLKIDIEEKPNFNMGIIEPSEPDYEFELDDSKEATPSSEKFLDAISNPANLIESLLINEPKLEFVTEYLSITTVQKITDYASTATIVAHNCLPKDINLKTCLKPVELPPSIPLPSASYGQNNAIKPKPKPVHEEQKIERNELKNFFPTKKPEKEVPTVPPTSENPYNILDQLNQYLIMNANRLIFGSGGYEVIDLNAESTIIEPEYPSQYGEELLLKKKK